MYDAVVILGSRPFDASWRFPEHVYTSLYRAVELYRAGSVKYIVVAGKWTIDFDILNIKQPFAECDAMAVYLRGKGIPDEAILRESDSKDSISNLYYLKRQIFEPYNLKNLLFVAAQGRIGRIDFLCKKILGPGYDVHAEGVQSQNDVTANEVSALQAQSEFLAPMQDGDDTWLDGKFFDDPFYRAAWIRVHSNAAQEPLIHLAVEPTATVVKEAENSYNGA